MLAWAVHLMKTKTHSCNVTASDPAAPVLLADHNLGEARVADSLIRRVAHFSRVAESRVAAPRLRATQPTLKVRIATP